MLLVLLTGPMIVERLQIHFILSQAVNSMHIKCKKNWYFSTVKKYHIFSLVTDTIYIFTVAKQGFLDNFGTGIFIKRFKVKDICQK